MGGTGRRGGSFQSQDSPDPRVLCSSCGGPQGRDGGRVGGNRVCNPCQGAHNLDIRRGALAAGGMSRFERRSIHRTVVEEEDSFALSPASTTAFDFFPLPSTPSPAFSYNYTQLPSFNTTTPSSGSSSASPASSSAYSSAYSTAYTGSSATSRGYSSASATAVEDGYPEPPQGFVPAWANPAPPSFPFDFPIGPSYTLPNPAPSPAAVAALQVSYPTPSLSPLPSSLPTFSTGNSEYLNSLPPTTSSAIIRNPSADPFSATVALLAHSPSPLTDPFYLRLVESLPSTFPLANHGNIDGVVVPPARTHGYRALDWRTDEGLHLRPSSVGGEGIVGGGETVGMGSSLGAEGIDWCHVFEACARDLAVVSEEERECPPLTEEEVE